TDVIGPIGDTLDHGTAANEVRLVGRRPFRYCTETRHEMTDIIAVAIGEPLVVDIGTIDGHTIAPAHVSRPVEGPVRLFLRYRVARFFIQQRIHRGIA